MELCVSMDIMTQEEFDKLAKSHLKWMGSEEKEGNPLRIENKDLSKLDFGRGNWYKKAIFNKCNFSGMTLQACSFQEAHFTDCNFDNAVVNYCVFSETSFFDVSFKDAIIYASKFERSRAFNFDAQKARITDCNFNGAKMLQVNFRSSDLKGSSFLNIDIEEANFYDVDCSGAKFISSIDFMKNHFKRSVPGGYYGYKVFDIFRNAPKYWLLEKGQIISETVNYDRSLACGCGIHIANLDCMKEFFSLNPEEKDKKIWKVYIAPEWLPGVVVPYVSKGSIRCERCQLIEEYTYEELFGKGNE